MPSLSGGPELGSSVVEEPLVICSYQPEWADDFRKLQGRAAGAVGMLAAAIEHVGSTAVPGMWAKPIIDVDVVVRAPVQLALAVERLESIGYSTHGRRVDVPGLVALKWPHGERRHHLYVLVDQSARHRERLALRDYLRSRPHEASRYSDFKRSTVAQVRGDWPAYEAAKRTFVESLLVAALHERRRG